MSCTILVDGSRVIGFLCDMERWETMGMAPCERCGQMGYGDCANPLCDLTSDELEMIDSERDRPDADYDEVVVMLPDDLVMCDYAQLSELYR